MKVSKTAYVVVEHSLTDVFIDGVYLQLAEARKRVKHLRIAEKIRKNYQVIIYYRTLREGKEDERS